MQKLRNDPGVTTLCSKAYAGFKAEQMLQWRATWQDMSDGERARRKLLASKWWRSGETTATGVASYEQFRQAEALSDDEVEKLSDCILAGEQAKDEVVRYHDWLLSCNNPSLPPAPDDAVQKQLEVELTRAQNKVRFATAYARYAIHPRQATCTTAIERSAAVAAADAAAVTEARVQKQLNVCKVEADKHVHQVEQLVKGQAALHHRTAQWLEHNSN